jgi:hypothetical protein
MNQENEPREHNRIREGLRRERSRSRSHVHQEPRNQHVIAEIHSIAGGFVGGGESSSARKAYAGQARSWEVLTVERPLKSRKKETPILGFSDDDYVGVSLPHIDALVITLTIVNHNIHQILWIIKAWLTFYTGQPLCIWI